MLKSVTFHDFNLLNLKGSLKHLSFGQYVNKYKNSSRSDRRKIIYYHYKNLY